jgi:hypothetical protein
MVLEDDGIGVNSTLENHKSIKDAVSLTSYFTTPPIRLMGQHLIHKRETENNFPILHVHSPLQIFLPIHAVASLATTFYIANEDFLSRAKE